VQDQHHRIAAARAADCDPLLDAANGDKALLVDFLRGGRTGDDILCGRDGAPRGLRTSAGS
jgi:hypothetical protein